MRCAGGTPLADTQVRKAIAEAEASLGATGRLVIRPSGTEPLIRVMGEGVDSQLVEAAVDSVCDALRHVPDPVEAA